MGDVFRTVYCKFWQDIKVQEDFTPEDRYFYVYLLTNPHTTAIGVYQITVRQMSFELGYTQESVKALMFNAIPPDYWMSVQKLRRFICFIKTAQRFWELT